MLFTFSIPALVQGSEVEINMDVLDGYQPPPMFEDKQETFIKPLTKEHQFNIKTDMEIVPQFTPPKPKIKPQIKYSEQSYINKAEDLLEKNLVTPSVFDVLEQIDPEIDITEIKTPIATTTEQKNNTIKTVLPTSLNIDNVKKITITFLSENANLTSDVKQFLIEQILVKSTRHPNIRIEIQSFASNIDGNICSARRVSLARALEIRDLLINHYIDPKRIDIRALGNKTNIKPIDRVDILFLE
ncbi:MAG: OmpA family protein [Alphaproteobacteria bacterium]|nr:OmpA family protein [Alphaproteobacteria bacterium]